MYLTTSTLLALAGISAAQITVNVGGPTSGPFVFTPASVKASKGSVVTFVYSGSPGNHSVTQSSFAEPCQPLAGGFSSGNIQIPANMSSGFPTWNLTITDDTKPIWFYCQQEKPLPHCAEGMVGAINAPETGNTFEVFKQAAGQPNIAFAQGPGNLFGVGASATALPGPFTGNITGFGLPTGVAAAATPTESASAAPTESEQVPPPSGMATVISSPPPSTSTAVVTADASTSEASSTQTPGNGAGQVVPDAVLLAVAAFFGVILA